MDQPCHGCTGARGQASPASPDHLLANAIIFHNTLDIADVVRQLQAEGEAVEPEDLAQISPYLTEHIMRFGEYSTHELALEPEAYEPRLDVDFWRHPVVPRLKAELGWLPQPSTKFRRGTPWRRCHTGEPRTSAGRPSSHSIREQL
jgi:hypothetical protein